jgi:transcriptional regulator GlxA family with amidase domain
MKESSSSLPFTAPQRGALAMLVYEDAEILDIAGPLDILCAATVRTPMDKRRALLVSESGGAVQTYPSGISVTSVPFASLALR